MDPSQPDTPSNTIHLRPAEQADDAAIHAMIRKERLNPLAITWSHFVLAVTQSGEIIGCCQVKTHRDGSASWLHWSFARSGAAGESPAC